MRKNKLLLVSISLASLLSLSACALFNDDDMAVKNNYNPPSFSSEEDPNAPQAGGVTGITVKDVNDAYCFKSIVYGNEDGKIINTYKVGGVNENEFNVNGGKDFDVNSMDNNFDLYVPNSLNKDEEQTVVLFVHGGAWVSGFKTDVNPYCFEFANRGYISATIKYTLLDREMSDSSLSVFRNLDEIDACIKTMKDVLTNDLGFTNLKLVIGGASSGSHLAMLYTYSRGASSPLPIRFIIDAVGPVDIKPEAWRYVEPTNENMASRLTYEGMKEIIAAGKDQDLGIAGDKNDAIWNDIQTVRIANGMCGIPYGAILDFENDKSLTEDEKKTAQDRYDEAEPVMTKVGGGQDQLSVTYWINKGATTPVICAYAGLDTVVGANQFATLEHVLIDNNIIYDYVFFKDSKHTEISAQKDPTSYNSFVNKIVDWCEHEPHKA